MGKPKIINKLELPNVTKASKEKLTREEYLNRVKFSADKELYGKLYDITQQYENSVDHKEKMRLMREKIAIWRELHKQIPPIDNDFIDFSFEPDEVGYNETGMRDDDEYNPKNWEGHCD
jgi:hypothetical protein